MSLLSRGSTAQKLGLLSALYFSQGLPFGFFTQALPVMLREQGFSLSAIGLSSALALPWALKFLWAPIVDRHHMPALGRRRSWILPLQAAAAVLLTALALSAGYQHMALLLGAVFVLNLISATQDIATDGLAVDMLRPGERGLANGVQVAGYRVGMIVGGGALLILFDTLGAANTFLAMSGLLALASAPVWFAREAPRQRAASDAGGTDEGSSIWQFLRRPQMMAVLALIVSYKLGDAFATAMLRPFLSDLGLEMADIGWLLGTVGFVSGLLGALAGGALVNGLGRKRSLLVFGALQAASVAGYAYLAAATAPTLLELYLLCGFEHFAGGMATAALFTCMMDWSAPDTAATDYTIQASAVVIATGVASMLAGFSAQGLGYLGHFSLAALLALASLAVVARLFPEQIAAPLS